MTILRFAGRCPICRGWPVLIDYAGGWAAECPQIPFEDSLEEKPRCAFLDVVTISSLYLTPNEAVEAWNQRVSNIPDNLKKE